MLTTSDLELLQRLFDKNNNALRKELRDDLRKDLQQAIEPLATKKQLENLVTKDQLKLLATKEQLESLATKEQLKLLATKEELKLLATKEDLKSLATKDELGLLRSQFMSFEKRQKRQGRAFSRKLNLIAGFFDKEIVALKKQVDSIKRIQA